MQKIIKSPTLLITLMCLLTIASPYIQQTISNAIKLIIEIIIVVILLKKHEVKIENIKLCHPIVIFLLLALISTILYCGLSTKLLNAIVTIGAYILFYIIIHVLCQKHSKEKILSILQKNLVTYTIIMDIIVIFTLGKGMNNTPEPVYLIGNKFMLSYLHMFVLALISYNNLNLDLKKIIYYFIYSFIILFMADTTTGLLGLIIVMCLLLGLKKYKEKINILTNPKVLISFFILINGIFLLSNGFANIGFIRDFLLSRSHTSSVLSGRLVMYEICKNAILKNPIFGYGINYDIVNSTLGFGNPQNGMLKLLLDYGLIGLISFCIIMYSSFKKVYSCTNKELKILIVSFIYGMLICSLVEINLAAIFMIGMSLCNIAAYTEKKSDDIINGGSGMKKIGIMSMQRIVNYGSFLQAYGLKKTIENLGYKVEFVDYHIEKPIIEGKESFTVTQKIINKIKYHINIKRKINDKRMKFLYTNSIEKHLNITPERNYPYDKIDALVIGSDEVFNCMQGYPVGYSKELFGKNYENITVITYAACFGNTSLENLKKYKIDHEISSMLKNMKSISVRDQNSYNIVKELTDSQPEINLDPVLISDIEEDMIDNVKIKDYILLYAYPCRFTKEESIEIKKLAEKYNKKIVTIGGYQQIADINLVVEPFELFAYFKHADFVITDTFHGSIFSIKNHSKFCTIARKGPRGNNNKLVDLLERLDKKECLVNDINDIENLYKEKLDYKKTDSIIKKERENSIKYLASKLK